jgi:hypothetical protein
MESGAEREYPPEMAERATVAGLFYDSTGASGAIADLQANGFSADALGVAMFQRDLRERLITETGTQSVEDMAKSGENAFETIKHIFQRDPYDDRNLVKVLMGMGIPIEEAQRFEAGLEKGGALVTVDVRGRRTREAVAILERHGADTGRSRTTVDTLPPMPPSAYPPDSTGL